MVEIMMSSVTNKYAHSALHELRERGMMRHNIKRRAKTLDEITTEMMRRCNVHDKVQVETFTKTIFPSLTQDYIDNYGSLTLRLQNMFMKHFDNQLTLIKVATKNALDKAMIKHSDVMTDIQMVAMMCSAGIYVYNAICNSVDHMLYGISKTTRAKSLHNEKMINAAKDLLREMGGNVAAPEKEGGDARKFAQDFMKELVKEDLMKMVENIGDISRNAQKILPVVRLLKDVATILKFDVRHVLFASLRPTGRNGEITKVYHYMMKMLEGKKEKSDEKEIGEKTEEKV